MSNREPVVPATAHPEPTEPDAELLVLLAQFDQLERAYCVVLTRHQPGSPEDKAADEDRERIVSEQDKLIPGIGNLAPKTLPGAAALARSLALWDAELFKNHTSTGQILTAILVEALLAMDATAGPDAELIAAAAEFRRLAETGSPREEAAIAEQRHVIEQMAAAAHRMVGMVATTPAGLAARVMAIGRSDPRHQLDHYGGTSKVLLDALLRDGAALAGAPTSNPDAELLALRPEYERRLAAAKALEGAKHVPDAEATPIFEAFEDLCARVAQMPPAVTSEGRALQAVCVMHQLAHVADWRSGEEPTSPEGLAWQVLAGQVGDAYPIPCTGRPL